MLFTGKRPKSERTFFSLTSVLIASVLSCSYLFSSSSSGVYNPTKADIWSLGATVWEMAESTPPFHEAASAGDLRDRWPPLTRAKEFSRSLHDFLTLCSNPVASRPDVSVLAQVSTFSSGEGVLWEPLADRCRNLFL